MLLFLLPFQLPRPFSHPAHLAMAGAMPKVALSGAILIVAATAATANRVCFPDYSAPSFFSLCVAVVEAPKAFRQMPAKRRIKK